MKNIKRIIFICLIFLLSGCSVEYDLNINEDNSVTEKVVAAEKTNRIESMTGQRGEQAITYMYNMFKRDDKSSITSRKDGNYTVATVTKVHDNIDRYAEDFRADVFKKIYVEKKDGVVTLTATQNQVLDKSLSSSLLYDTIQINITLPYVVVDNNADQVKRNTYTWNIKKNDDLKTIKLKYKENNDSNKVNLNFNGKTVNVAYGLIIGIGFAIVILIIFTIVFFKNRKNNIV